jgi:hypothetical protein
MNFAAMRFPFRSILSMLFALSCTGLWAQVHTAKEKEVLSVIDRFFAYLAARDSSGMASIMEADGTFGSAVIGSSARPPRMHTHASYLAGLKKGNEAWLERYWDAEVNMDDAVAVVTCPYDFHVDGTFSHCGLDIFTLMRHSDGWKIAGAVFSMQQEGCPLSPLGPVKK